VKDRRNQKYKPSAEWGPRSIRKTIVVDYGIAGHRWNRSIVAALGPRSHHGRDDSPMRLELEQARALLLL
jgi:hypothetical protein